MKVYRNIYSKKRNAFGGFYVKSINKSTISVFYRLNLIRWNYSEYLFSKKVNRRICVGINVKEK